MTIKDSIKKVFGHGEQAPSDSTTSTSTGQTGQPTGSHTVTQHRDVRAPDPHVPAGTAAGAIWPTDSRMRRIRVDSAVCSGLYVLPARTCIKLLSIRAEVYCCP